MSDQPECDHEATQSESSDAKQAVPPLSPGSNMSPSSSNETAAHDLDIGILIRKGSLSQLPQNEKLEIINHSPDIAYNYPTRHMHGCNRCFKPEWNKSHPWLHYSKSDDGVYYKACALFAPSDVRRQNLGKFVSSPFYTWTKQSSAFRKHEELQYHQESMVKMVAFRQSCLDVTKSIACMLNKEREQQLAQNKAVLKSLFECVCFCAKQGLSFRGHRRLHCY